MKLIFYVFLLVSIACVLGQDDLPEDPMDTLPGLNENCLRCLCHARTGCYRLKNCGSYSISIDYWITAGRPTVLDDDPSSPSSHKYCIRDDHCVMTAIRGYINTIPESQRDCNCDGRIDCKDYAALHYKGEQCRSDFNSVYLTRLDKCLAQRNITTTRGWSMTCQLPSPQ